MSSRGACTSVFGHARTLSMRFRTAVLRSSSSSQCRRAVWRASGRSMPRSGRDRIKAAEQMSAHGNPHGDRVWMSWHASHPSNPPSPYTHLTVEVVSRIIGTGGYTQRWLYLHGCIGEPDACVFGRWEPKLQSDDRRGSRCSSSDWEPSAFETLASPIRMCRKRSFATYARERPQARASVCRIQCRILCLAYVERNSMARRPDATSTLQRQFRESSLSLTHKAGPCAGARWLPLRATVTDEVL